MCERTMWELVVLALYCIGGALSQAPLFDFGSSVPDNAAFGGPLMPLTITTPPYDWYGQTYNDIIVGPHGLICMGASTNKISVFESSALEIVEGSGTLWYREATDVTPFVTAISVYDPCVTTATNVFVITYEDQTSTNVGGVSNTYQIVVVMTSGQTYVMLNFLKLDALDSPDMITAVRAAGGLRYTESLSAINALSQSNVGTPGRYTFVAKAKDICTCSPCKLSTHTECVADSNDLFQYKCISQEGCSTVTDVQCSHDTLGIDICLSVGCCWLLNGNGKNFQCYMPTEPLCTCTSTHEYCDATNSACITEAHCGFGNTTHMWTCYTDGNRALAGHSVTNVAKCCVECHGMVPNAGGDCSCSDVYPMCG